MTVSDIELDRALNALTTTFNDQRVDAVDVARIESIVTGSLAGERKLQARRESDSRAALHKADDGSRLATLERKSDGRWISAREREAQGSHVAVPSS
jgi:hypothetical protein